MHDRLAEIGEPVPSVAELTPEKQPTTPLRRDTYSVTKETNPPRMNEVDNNEGR